MNTDPCHDAGVRPETSARIRFSYGARWVFVNRPGRRDTFANTSVDAVSRFSRVRHKISPDNLTERPFSSFSYRILRPSNCK